MIFPFVQISVAIVCLRITLTKDTPKWGLIVMVLTTSLLIAEGSIEVSEGIGPFHLLIPGLVSVSFALGIIVHRLVQRLTFYGEGGAVCDRLKSAGALAVRKC